jgi:hypothetical protein
MRVPLPIASQELSDIWDLHAITDEYRGLFAISKDLSSILALDSAGAFFLFSFLYYPF